MPLIGPVAHRLGVRDGLRRSGPRGGGCLEKGVQGGREGEEAGLWRVPWMPTWPITRPLEGGKGCTLGGPG